MDDDISISQSSAEYLESPHKAKMKALKRKIEEKGIKVEGDQQHDLKALQLALLRGQVDKNADVTKATTDAERQAKGTSQGTKTREQELAEGTLNAMKKLSTDDMVKQGKQQEKAMQELKKDEVQTEDA